MNNAIFDGLLSSVLSTLTSSELSEMKTSLPILTNMVNTEKNITIYCELPGVQKSDIELDFYENTLTVKAHKKKPEIPAIYEPGSFFEIRYGKLSTKITLPIVISDENEVKSVFENGMLTINIDKKIEERNVRSLRVT